MAKQGGVTDLEEEVWRVVVVQSTEVPCGRMLARDPAVKTRLCYKEEGETFSCVLFASLLCRCYPCSSELIVRTFDSPVKVVFSNEYILYLPISSPESLQWPERFCEKTKTDWRGLWAWS